MKGEGWWYDARIVKATGVKGPFYHGTTSLHEKQVDREGLCTPKRCRRQQQFPSHLLSSCRRHAIYLTRNPTEAIDYARRHIDKLINTADRELSYRMKLERQKGEGIQPVVYRIDKVPRRCKLAYDPEHLWFHDEEELARRARSFMAYDCDCIKPTLKLCRTWEKCADIDEMLWDERVPFRKKEWGVK